MVNKKQKPYLVWRFIAYEGWSYDEYKTLKEAVKAMGYSDGEDDILTKRVDFNIKEQ